MPNASHEQRCRTERIEMLARQSRTGTRVALTATAILGLMIVPAVGWQRYAIWALCMLAAYLTRDIVVRKILRSGSRTAKDENLVAMSSVALAAVINAPGLLFLPAMSPDIRGLYTAVQSSWVAVGALIIGIHARSYGLYVALSYLLLAAGWWRIVDAPLAGMVSCALLLAAFVLVRFSQRLTHLFNESVEIRHQNEDLVDKLTASIAETSAAQLARSRFLAAASHDLLQPVHALMLLVGVLRDSESPHAKEQAARRIELTATSISSMFRGLLDQARLDAGAVDPKLEIVSLATICRALEAAYVARCQEKGLMLTIECPDDAYALADASLLDRALRNVTDNAVKFTESGSVSLRIRSIEHRISVDIVDTGIGIESTDQPRVFEAFFRGSVAERSSMEGFGLGLSVTEQLVKLMGGTISVRSQQGIGTHVEITFIAAYRSPSPIVPASGASRTLSAQRILVIEDDRNSRDALQLWLGDRGCAVVAAASLTQAFALCSAQSFVPQFLLCDFHLAEGPDGIGAIHALRDAFGTLPAALITGAVIEAHDTPDGVSVLRKPIQVRQLESLLLDRKADVKPAAGAHR